MSIHELSGQVAMKLSVNGTELDLQSNRVESIMVRNHVLYKVPTMEFRIESPNDLMQTAGLVDGSEIAVSIGPSSQSNKFRERSYKAFKVRPLPSGMKHIYDISSYYNKPDYFFKKVTKSNEGTSKDTIYQMLQEENIDSDIDATSDRQVWRNTGLSKADWIRKVCLPRMYGDENSAFLYAYSSISDQIRIKDISKIMQNQEVVEFVNNTRTVSSSVPSCVFYEYSTNFNSGQHNAGGGGYGTSGHSYNLTKGALVSNSGAKVTVSSGDLNINASNAGSTTKVLYDPVNVGNTHDNYHKAKVQNARIISTFSNYLDLLTPMSSGCDVLDPVSVKLHNRIGNATADPTVSGKYICVGIDMLATTGQYYEKVHLVRNNIDVPNSGLLISDIMNVIEGIFG